MYGLHMWCDLRKGLLLKIQRLPPRNKIIPPGQKFEAKHRRSFSGEIRQIHEVWCSLVQQCEILPWTSDRQTEFKLRSVLRLSQRILNILLNKSLSRHSLCIHLLKHGDHFVSLAVTMVRESYAILFFYNRSVYNLRFLNLFIYNVQSILDTRVSRHRVNHYRDST